MSSKKGISLVSLVITIIVIMILAAIVIFNGFETTESAEFAKFAQEFSGYQEEIDQRYLTTKTQSVLDGRRKKDSAIYSEMGSPAGTVLEVLDGLELQEPLEGTNCYLLTPDREIYDENERIYVTDKGEVFTLPGYDYEVNGEMRYYISANNYYIGEGGQGGQLGPNPYEEMKGTHGLYNCSNGMDYIYLGTDRQGNNLFLIDNWVAIKLDFANSTLNPSQLAAKLTNNFEQIPFYNWEECDDGDSLNPNEGGYWMYGYSGLLFENGRNPFIVPGFEGSKVRALTLDDFVYNGYNISGSNNPGNIQWILEHDEFLFATPENNGLLNYDDGAMSVVSEGLYGLIPVLVVPPHIELNLCEPPAPC